MNAPLAPAPLLAVLHEVADRQPRTTAQLAIRAGIKVSAFATAQRQLRDYGVLCDADDSWIAPDGVDLLDSECIRDHLAALCCFRPCAIRVLGVTGSTNDDARTLLEEGTSDGSSAHAVLAEAQVAGRGRRGRSWQSPVASSLYLTQVEPLAGGPETARGLSLAIGVAVAEALERLHGIKLELKWPNDLMSRGRKLGGILVELAYAQGRCHALMGIGVNVRIPSYSTGIIDQPWSDLAGLGVTSMTRNEIAAALIASVCEMVELFRQRGFDQHLRARWQARDPFFGKAVQITSADEVISGVAWGIDGAGELLVDTATGRRVCGAGEVSIQIAPGAADPCSPSAEASRSDEYAT